MTLDDCRRFYAEEIGFVANVRSRALLDAFARVPREHFLGPGPWRLASVATTQLTGVEYVTTEDADPRHVYHNIPISIDATRDLNNGQPSALARWMDALDLKPGARVFHLGCGVGYFTAIMAEVVGANGKVIASEIDAQLAERARHNLAGLPQVEVRSGDGAATDPGECDAMLINAGVTHVLPLWLERLREGGRLAVPLTVAMGSNLGKGVMAVVTRERGGFSARTTDFIAIYNCGSARDPKLEPLLGKAMQTFALMKMRSLRTDAHESGENCIVHLPGCCWSLKELSASEGSEHARTKDGA